MVADANTVMEVDGHHMAKAHGAPDMFADFLCDRLIVQAEMATRLAAAEWHPFGKEMEGGPDREMLGREAFSRDLIHTEPEPWTRQAADFGDRLLDEPFEFVLSSLSGRRLSRIKDRRSLAGAAPTTFRLPERPTRGRSVAAFG
ncbi:MAG TPA: hypothetical protein VNC50_13335 [Planctomycetia bacterium]|nr:hypothetical protein [Planctomycetia bacterium]